MEACSCVELPITVLPDEIGWPCSSMEKATKWDWDDDGPTAAYANHMLLLASSRLHHPPAVRAAAVSSSSSCCYCWKKQHQQKKNAIHHLRPSSPRRRMPHRKDAHIISNNNKMMWAELDEAGAHIAHLEQDSKRLLRKLAEEKQATRLERKHRRQLEAANARLLRELAEARLSWRQRYEAERKARELMEEACSELTREVEEDQAEVELLRRECLRMRDNMEEERRMLQMAEVWREERVQMKLSDAKLALETKYADLNRLQAEMEAFLRRGNDAAAISTDLFLAAKVDGDNGSSADLEYDGGRDSCSWVGRSGAASPVAVPDNNVGSSSSSSSRGARSMMSSSKNTSRTALIRRLWRPAISNSRRDAAETSGSVDHLTPITNRKRDGKASPLPSQQQQQQSLKGKLMEARMDR